MRDRRLSRGKQLRIISLNEAATETETAISSWNTKLDDAARPFFSLSFAHTLQLPKYTGQTCRLARQKCRKFAMRASAASSFLVERRARNVRKRCVSTDGRKRKRLIGGLSWKSSRGIVFKSEHETSFPLARPHAGRRPRTCVPRQAGARAALPEVVNIWQNCESSRRPIAYFANDRKRHAHTRWGMLEIDLLGASTNREANQPSLFAESTNLIFYVSYSEFAKSTSHGVFCPLNRDRISLSPSRISIILSLNINMWEERECDKCYLIDAVKRCYFQKAMLFQKLIPIEYIFYLSYFYRKNASFISTLARRLWEKTFSLKISEGGNKSISFFSFLFFLRKYSLLTFGRQGCLFS